MIIKTLIFCQQQQNKQLFLNPFKVETFSRYIKSIEQILKVLLKISKTKTSSTLQDRPSPYRLWLIHTFSIFSLNIRSLPKKLDTLKILIQDIDQGNFKFNVMGLQEIWSLPESYDYSFAGYSKIEFNLRNNNSRVNCGGGVAFLIDEHYEYEILSGLSLLIPHIFESLFCKN